MKTTYECTRSQWATGAIYADLKLSLIQYCICQTAAMPYPEEDVQWHELGKSYWAWRLTNNSLSVDTPVEERWDLFKAQDKSTNPELLASIIKVAKENKYRGFLYDATAEKLKKVRDFEPDQIEGAKNVMRVLALIDKEE